MASEELLSYPRYTFPDDPIFTQLLHVSRNIQGHVIYDGHGFYANYCRILSDILQLRQALLGRLPKSAFNEQGMLLEKRRYICILVLKNYEFIIAFFATLAIGGACVPLASGVLPEEAHHFLRKADSTYLLVGSDLTKEGSKIKHYIQETASRDITIVPIVLTNEAVTSLPNVEIDGHIQLPPTQPSLVLFTSGTTGLPKGVVLPRRRWYVNGKSESDSFTLSYRPPHWIGGARTLIWPVLTGGRIYILENRASPEVFWNCIREAKITNFAVTTTTLRELKDHFEQTIGLLSPAERNEYTAGLKSLRSFTCSGAVIAPSIRLFWHALCTDLYIQNWYASTEAGGAITGTFRESQLPHSIGWALPGVIVKLSDGDHGEVLVKSSLMLTHYLDDEVATKTAIDEEGFYRTGDLAHRVGDEYIFDGRASTDYILYYGYRVSILELENSLLDLPYISEAYVLGVPDHETKELVGALVRIRRQAISSTTEAENNEQVITLAKIRADLVLNVATHKLPAVLRILQDGEDVPRTVSDKAIKKGLLQQYFGISANLPVDHAVPGVEKLGGDPAQVATGLRPWDWCGLQRAS